MTKDTNERISPVATRSQHTDFTCITTELVQQKIGDARSSERKRDMHLLHRGNESMLHRMLNSIQPGTYCRPHRHLDPPKAETFLILQGRAAVVFFSEHGEVLTDGVALLDPEAGALGVDIRPGVWHTLVALAPDTVLFECKNGPYTRASDKDFAQWAPDEGADGADAYLHELENHIRFSLGG